MHYRYLFSLSTLAHPAGRRGDDHVSDGSLLWLVQHEPQCAIVCRRRRRRRCDGLDNHDQLSTAI